MWCVLGVQYLWCLCRGFTVAASVVSDCFTFAVASELRGCFGEGSEVSAELEFLNQHNFIPSMDNKSIKQRLEKYSTRAAYQILYFGQGDVLGLPDTEGQMVHILDVRALEE
ncbi:Sucrose synthase [Vigna unguiculata]|uniref:Sucrose synthase n=1 Tax=Vigna unguiculata TaxID=3917 RepID=A0A4D6MPE0_VIGUN|nr:Sucrose synthase [Vigna unguiculata]